MKQLYYFLSLVALTQVAAVTPARAVTDNWALQLHAGLRHGQPSGFAPTTIGLRDSVENGFHASFTTVQVGIYGVDPDPAKRANKDYRVYDPAVKTYRWNLVLEAGTARYDSPIEVAWWIPAEPYNIRGTGWRLKLFRGDNCVAVYDDDGNYGIASLKVAASDVEIAPGTKEEWSLVAEQVVPDPTGTTALASMLTLAGAVCRKSRYV